MTHMGIAGIAQHEIADWGPREYDASRPVLFMHIPKTSGVALAQGLAEVLQAENPIEGFDRSLFGHFEAYDEIAPELRQRIFLSTLLMPENPDVVCAHVAHSTLKERYVEPQCVTFLREPVSRLLSHWIYWRSHSDELLRPWGPWGDYVREARRSLADFLSSRRVACQTDNISLRMLLWPHPLIPSDDFIAEENDQVLVTEAIERMREFAYLDVIENPALSEGLSDWLGAPFQYKSLNETQRLPEQLRLTLHETLSAPTFALLERRSRLDLQLWHRLVLWRGGQPESLRCMTIMRTIARHALILNMPPAQEPSRLQFLAAAAARKMTGLLA